MSEKLFIQRRYVFFTLDLGTLENPSVGIENKDMSYSKIMLSDFRGFDKMTHKAVVQKKGKTHWNSLETQPPLVTLLMNVPW